MKNIMCPHCDKALTSIYLSYNQKSFDKCNIDLTKETLSFEIGEIMDSHISKYSCGNCYATLPMCIIDKLSNFKEI